MRAARFCFRRIGNKVWYSSVFKKPRRVLTETGREVAFFALLMQDTARSGVLIMAAPPPVLLTFLSGQPILISRPSKPRLAMLFAIFSKCSGLLPQIWATIGFSPGPILRRSKAFSRPFSEAKLETLVNSVKKISGRPTFKMT